MILQQVRKYRVLLMGIGTKKLYKLLQEHLGKELLKGMGRDRLFRLLRKHNMLIKARKSYNGPGTDSRGARNVYENKKRKLEIKRNNQLLESDITNIRINGKPTPLSITEDVSSRKILGWHIGKDWSAEETRKSLEEAARSVGEKIRGSIHHSDQGSVFAGEYFREYYQEHGIIGSMSRKGTPTDAAHIERLNKTLKYEFGLGRNFGSRMEAIEAMHLAVTVYNELRPHWSLGLRTPSEVYAENN